MNWLADLVIDKKIKSTNIDSILSTLELNAKKLDVWKI